MIFYYRFLTIKIPNPLNWNLGFLNYNFKRLFYFFCCNIVRIRNIFRNIFSFKYVGKFKPAILNRSFKGGTVFIIPDTKFAVEPLPSVLFPESQTVILSILIFLTASTCVLTNSGNFSINNNWNAFLDHHQLRLQLHDNLLFVLLRFHTNLLLPSIFAKSHQLLLCLHSNSLCFCLCVNNCFLFCNFSRNYNIRILCRTPLSARAASAFCSA